MRSVRAVIGGVRELYERQDFNFAGPWGDNGFIEDYTAEVRGKPLGCLHLITFNADGQAQHIAANYRPLSSLMFFSRLLRERVAGTAYAEHFLWSKSFSPTEYEVAQNARTCRPSRSSNLTAAPRR